MNKQHSRSTNEQRQAFTESLYCNYAELQHQKEELQERKHKINYETYDSNAKEIHELLFNDISSAEAELGDWNTYEKVQGLIKKTVYGRSTNLYSVDEKEGALLKKLNKLEANMATLASDVKRLTGDLRSSQEEVSGLLNLMNMKDNEIRVLTGKSNRLLMQMRFKERECDNLRRQIKVLTDASEELLKRLEKHEKKDKKTKKTGGAVTSSGPVEPLGQDDLMSPSHLTFPTQLQFAAQSTSATPTAQKPKKEKGGNPTPSHAKQSDTTATKTKSVTSPKNKKRTSVVGGNASKVVKNKSENVVSQPAAVVLPKKKNSISMSNCADIGTVETKEKELVKKEEPPNNTILNTIVVADNTEKSYTSLGAKNSIHVDIPSANQSSADSLEKIRNSLFPIFLPESDEIKEMRIDLNLFIEANRQLERENEEMRRRLQNMILIDPSAAYSSNAPDGESRQKPVPDVVTQTEKVMEITEEKLSILKASPRLNSIYDSAEARREFIELALPETAAIIKLQRRSELLRRRVESEIAATMELLDKDANPKSVTTFEAQFPSKVFEEPQEELPKEDRYRASGETQLPGNIHREEVVDKRPGSANDGGEAMENEGPRDTDRRPTPSVAAATNKTIVAPIVNLSTGQIVARQGVVATDAFPEEYSASDERSSQGLLPSTQIQDSSYVKKMREHLSSASHVMHNSEADPKKSDDIPLTRPPGNESSYHGITNEPKPHNAPEHSAEKLNTNASVNQTTASTQETVHLLGENGSAPNRVENAYVLGSKQEDLVYREEMSQRQEFVKKGSVSSSDLCCDPLRAELEEIKRHFLSMKEEVNMFFEVLAVAMQSMEEEYKAAQISNAEEVGRTLENFADELIEKRTEEQVAAVLKKKFGVNVQRKSLHDEMTDEEWLAQHLQNIALDLALEKAREQTKETANTAENLAKDTPLLGGDRWSPEPLSGVTALRSDRTPSSHYYSNRPNSMNEPQQRSQVQEQLMNRPSSMPPSSLSPSSFSHSVEQEDLHEKNAAPKAGNPPRKFQAGVGVEVTEEDLEQKKLFMRGGAGGKFQHMAPLAPKDRWRLDLNEDQKEEDQIQQEEDVSNIYMEGKRVIPSSKRSQSNYSWLYARERANDDLRSLMVGHTQERAIRNRFHNRVDVMQMLLAMQPQVQNDLNFMQPTVYRYIVPNAASRATERFKSRMNKTDNYVVASEFDDVLSNEVMPIVRKAEDLQKGKTDIHLLKAVKQLREEDVRRRRQNAKHLFKRVVTAIKTENLIQKNVLRGDAFTAYIRVLYAQWRNNDQKKQDQRKRVELQELRHHVLNVCGLQGQAAGQPASPQPPAPLPPLKVAKGTGMRKPGSKYTFGQGKSSTHFNDVQFMEGKK